ncbi:hypothetical protein C8Q78DRAFT_219181 [Trametes maxima]|nr:hypothetical protein C8Q78DRAFT_219181 [Trametes maxima]
MLECANTNPTRSRHEETLLHIQNPALALEHRTFADTGAPLTLGVHPPKKPPPTPTTTTSADASSLITTCPPLRTREAAKTPTTAQARPARVGTDPRDCALLAQVVVLLVRPAVTLTAPARVRWSARRLSPPTPLRTRQTRRQLQQDRPIVFEHGERRPRRLPPLGAPRGEMISREGTQYSLSSCGHSQHCATSDSDTCP